MSDTAIHVQKCGIHVTLDVIDMAINFFASCLGCLANRCKQVTTALSRSSKQEMNCWVLVIL